MLALAGAHCGTPAPDLEAQRGRLETLATDPGLNDRAALTEIVRAGARVSSEDRLESTRVDPHAGGLSIRLVLHGHVPADSERRLRWIRLVRPESGHLALLIQHYGRKRNVKDITIARKMSPPHPRVDQGPAAAQPVFTFYFAPEAKATTRAGINPFDYIPGRTQPGSITARGPSFTQAQAEGHSAVHRYETGLRITENNSQRLGMSGSLNIIPPISRLPDFTKLGGEPLRKE